MTQYLARPAARGQREARSTAFRRVREDVSLRINPDRCLRLRSRDSDCDRCAQACPPRVLLVDDERMDLADGCLRCGRCSAACPTGALQTEGFAASPPRAAEGEPPICVDCWKVPASHSPRGAMRVPCLGGIALNLLVQWHVESGGGRIVLVDRGWCRQCRAGTGADHPAQETLDEARVLLARLAVLESALPRIETSPLPRAQMPSDIPEALAAQRLTRREFFAGMPRIALGSVAPAAAGQPGKGVPSRRARMAKIEATPHSQLLEQAAVLAARHNRPLPADLFPALRVSDACRNHRVCAATCPTRALRTYENKDGAAAGIAFDATACIACGNCTRACPERALTLFPQGDGEVPSGPAALTRWTQRECYDCGLEFADPGAGNVCPTCRKTRDLAQTSFHPLFGSARGLHGEPPRHGTPAGTD